MVQLRDLKRLGPYEWEIPTSVRADMRVPVRLFASSELLQAIGGDASLEQAVNAATRATVFRSAGSPRPSCRRG